jgi:hypothetical protein
MHFVVMANTLSTVDPCDEIYDLKGSSGTPIVPLQYRSSTAPVPRQGHG